MDPAREHPTTAEDTYALEAEVRHLRNTVSALRDALEQAREERAREVQSAVMTGK